MPVTIKKENDAGETIGAKQVFILKRNWFLLSDTEGDQYAPSTPIAAWDKGKALEALNITETPFAHANGNCQGYATGRTIAVNPVAALPHKTRFHELAHVVLGHTVEHETVSYTHLTLPTKRIV